MPAETKRTLVQNVIDELQRQNPEISPAVLRKTVYHIAKLGSSPSENFDEIATVYPPMLYAEAQAYMDGFSAAIDGDFDTADVDISSSLEQESPARAKLDEYGSVLPSYMLARASHYSAVMDAAQPEEVENQFGSAIPALAASGFVSGFSAGIQELDEGHSFKPANATRPRSFYVDIARESVSSVIEGEHTPLVELTATYMQDLSSRKISTKSGRSRFSPDAEQTCLLVYGIGLVNGVLSAMGKQTEFEGTSDVVPSAQVKTELDVWCAMNGYPENVKCAARQASSNLVAEVGDGQMDEGLYLLNGWGFADGYASMTEERTFNPIDL